MYNTPMIGSGEHAQKLRKDAGKWLKSLREAANKTQMDVAKDVGYDYYTAVSQIELGKGRVAPDRYEVYAKSMGVDPSWFIINLIKFYDPFAYKLLQPMLKLPK